MPRPAPSKRRSSLTPFYVILGVVLLAGIAVLATQLGGGGGTAATQPVEVTLTPEQLQRVPGISIGRPDAPITIFEFADFQCPHCGQWATFIEPLIKERLVDTGKARYVFYDYPIGGDAFRHGFLAARAGRCANEQGKFWEMQKAMFARQQEWSYSDNPGERFAEYAGQAGLDVGAFEQCLQSEKYAREVSESRRLGESLGVQGTPTVFVNGQRLPGVPETYSAFETQVRAIAPGAFADAPAGPAPADSPAGTVTGTSPASP